MAWYDPRTWGPSNPEGLERGMTSGGIGAAPMGLADALAPDTDMLNKYGGRGGQFGDINSVTFGQLGNEANAQRRRLQDLAEGKNSIATEQLRQGLMQNMSAQRSMAASAAPQNQAMAARTAAMQMGRLGSGMAGASAMAGIEERNAANKALMESILQQRQQDLQATLGGYGLGVQAGGSIAGTPTGNQVLAGGVQDLLQLGAKAL